MSNNPKTLSLLAAESIGNASTFVALAEALGIGPIRKSVDLTHEYYIGGDSKSHEVYHLNIVYHLTFLPDFRFMVTWLYNGQNNKKDRNLSYRPESIPHLFLKS